MYTIPFIPLSFSHSSPRSTVLFNVCSAVTVECCVLYVCCYVRKKAFLQCLQLLRGWDMGLYKVPLSVSFLGFGIMDYVSQLPCVRYYVVVQEGLCVLGV